MVKAFHRIEKLEKALRLSNHALHFETDVVFIDSDGVVKSILRLREGQQEWIKGEAEMARAE
jgi:uncharacterized membrane protein (UPF0127 family)